MQKILVTGGLGFIGSNLTRMLLDKNYYVRIENPDGNAGRSTNNIITASTAPSFTTAAGSLGTFDGNFSGTLFTIQGSSDSAITFSEVTSNVSLKLPP